MTSDITLASSSGDSAALETITSYQAGLLGAAAVKTAAFLSAAANPTDLEPTREELAGWAESILGPYLRAEVDLLLPALKGVDDSAADELSTGNTKLSTLLDQVAASAGTADTAAAAATLQVRLAEHFHLHSSMALPALAAASGVSLAEVWGRVESAVGRGGAHAVDDGPRHVCECGVLDDDGLPELDVRTVPHAIRHATVFGALEAIEMGSGLVLAAHHDPLPLLAQIEQRAPGDFDVHYIERGPQVWKLQFRRVGGSR